MLKVLKLLTNNFGLKLISLGAAFLLWLVAININDPISTENFTVPVVLQNTDILASKGYYYEVLDNTDTVKVTVKAARSALSNISEKNIVAIADMGKLSPDNSVKIDCSALTSDRIEEVKPDREYVYLLVEEIKRKQLPINVNVQNELAEGYVLGGTSTSQTAVIVTGPESSMEQVDHAMVDINVDGATNDVNITLPVKIYDKSNNEIKDVKLSQSVDSVSTTATVLLTKTVPLEYEIVGSPADGYELAGQVEASVENITIVGKPAQIKNIFKIEISPAMDLSDLTKTTEETIDIKKYLPSGVNFAESNTFTKSTLTARIYEVIEEEEEVEE